MNYQATSPRGRSRREEIVLARQCEKLKWLTFDRLAAERVRYNLPPFHFNDVAIDTAAQDVITQLLPQMENLSIQQQVETLAPMINDSIARIAGGVVNGGSLTDTNKEAYNRMMGGSNNPATLTMPYNAGADDGDPYAALLLHQVREADAREAQLKIEDAERRKKQMNFLKEQVELKKKLEKEAKEKQLRFDLIQREKAHEWEREESAKLQQAEFARRAEYKRIMEYQQLMQDKLEREKQQIQQQDQMFLQNIADAAAASDKREQELSVRWKEQAKKTKEANDLRLGLRAEEARREVAEDKERIRVLLALQKAEDERRIANLESIKRHQETLTNLGQKAAEERTANDARIEAQIQSAIRKDEEKNQKRDQEKAEALSNFLEEPKKWKQQEDERKRFALNKAKREELDEVSRFKQKIIDDEAEDARKAQAKRNDALQMNVYLREQMRTRELRDRAAKVAMSPAELSMNAGVLQQFSPAQKPIRNAGRNVIQTRIF